MQYGILKNNSYNKNFILLKITKSYLSQQKPVKSSLEAKRMNLFLIS